MSIASDLSVAALWLGFGYAALHDWRKREVDDLVWIALGLAGALLGVVPLALATSGVPFGGWLGIGLWVLVAVFVLEHLLPWDVALGNRYERLPGIIELIVYASVGVVIVVSAFDFGFGARGTPYAVLAVYLSVVFGRVLFELGLLYGGADAKAVMVAGLVVPLWSVPWVGLPASATTILGAYPFSVTLLMDGALFAVVVPIAIAIRNLRTGDFELRRGFVAYPIAVRDLPDRFVWLKDPTFDPHADEAATSEDDRAIRQRQARELTAAGVERVWVTPQVPFVILLALGSVAGILLGNIVFDVAALL